MHKEAAPLTPSLKTLEDMLHNRIMQKKGMIHESYSEAYPGAYQER